MALGINFFGPIYSEDGIGEAARLTLKIFQTAGIDIALNALSRPVAREKISNTEEFNFSTPYNINYFHFSSRWVPHYLDQIGLDNLKDKYNISHWLTEVQNYPLTWAENVHHFNEIWTASSFCQDSIAMTLPIPTILISYPILADCAVDIKANLLPEHQNFSGFIFLVMANMYSDIERKNVLGSLEAFSQAFTQNEDVTLVVKLSNAEVDTEYFTKIKQYSDKDSRIIIFDRFIDRIEVDALYRSVDAYISLHRAEGFGLTIGEAMHHGISVITTAYSGNMDFCNTFNSYLVDYDLVEVGEDRLRYASTDLWANPKIDSAVEALRKVYSDSEDRIKKIENAKKYITKHFSIDAIAQKVRKRIELIDSQFNYQLYLDSHK